MSDNIKTYKGFINTSSYLENSDSLFIGDSSDPIAKVFADDFLYRNVSIRYWLSDSEKSKEELIKGFLNNVYGLVDADYGDRYSEATGYLWTNEELKIGGHDIIMEIWNNKGKYIYLEVEIG